MLLGVTGSIAAYKGVEVARRLMKAGCAVQVAMTAGATRFVTPLTFEAITGRTVLDDAWRRSSEIAHVERAHEADLVVVAPASANSLARMRAGMADDPLLAVLLSTEAPILVAPAMEHGMWRHPATRDNVATLVSRGVEVVGPATGALASGRSGDGRMVEPEEVVERALARLGGGAGAQEHVVITAGPTWEPIDPVRVLANRSTGAMGIALAEAAMRTGARVRLVLGPTHLRPAPHPNLELFPVETALEMLAAVEAGLESCSVLVGAAAVGDFRPAHPRDAKLKRSAADADRLELIENPDVLATAARQLRAARPDAVVVGFAAETEDVEANALKKLRAKGCDLVVGNVVGKSVGFGPGATEVMVVRETETPVRFGPASKTEVAAFVWAQALLERGRR